MIERYTLPKMEHLWSEDHRYEVMLEVELLACEALARLGKIPKSAPKEIRRKVSFDPERIREIEKKTRHDLLAFVFNLQESVGGELGRYIHMGLTSSDILDTSLAVLLRESAEILVSDLKTFLSRLRRKANQYKWTPCIGRSHGVHAEPITFGLKLAVFYDEAKRNLERLERAKTAISVGKISGAVGTYAHIDPFVETYVCRKLKLAPARISTQIVQRDHHAEFVTTLALIGSSLEKWATEIRHLQRTEVLEAEEFFHEGQKGSSAMPHKRNPVRCERLAGMARLLRGYAQVALENVTLWHERDISHSSAERVILPDATALLDYMLNEASDIMRDLLVYPENMMKNLGVSRGLIFSQRLLLALIEKGLSRAEAYDRVQHLSMKAWKDGSDFKEAVLSDGEIFQYLTQKDIEECFDLKYHMRHADRIFKRVGL